MSAPVRSYSLTGAVPVTSIDGRRLFPRRAADMPLALPGDPLRVESDRSEKRVADRETLLEAGQGHLSWMNVCTFRESRLMGYSYNSGALLTRWSVRAVSAGGACGAGDTSSASAPGTRVSGAPDGPGHAKYANPPRKPACSPLTRFPHARKILVNLGGLSR